MASAPARGLTGKRVAIFESRMRDEFANLVRKQGGEPIIGPTMTEAPLSLGPAQHAFADALRAGQVDALLVLTGVGNRKLVSLLEPIMSKDELSSLLARVVVVARGPKSVAALRELGIRPQVTALEPHTWQTLLSALHAFMPIAGKRIALQQYGVPHERLTEALTHGGAEVMQVPVYRWQLPDDTAPLDLVIDAICNGEVDTILFTSGPQAGVLVEVARRRGLEDKVRAALARIALGSVGPSCTEAMRNLELEPDFEPEHGKMGQLVLEASRKVVAVLESKRAVPG